MNRYFQTPPVVKNLIIINLLVFMATMLLPVGPHIERWCALWVGMPLFRTYQFVTSMQEIKLQDCERRRREEWEQTQADLYGVQMKSLRLQQNQEAGSILINEIKNILITVLAATSVINGQITLGAMLAIQYIVGQLTAPVEQLMAFVYSLQDVRISLERINEGHERREEEEDRGGITEYGGERSVVFSGVGFSYDRHSPSMTL